MLVLTRKVMESIVIGDNVEICLLEIRGDRVRLGIRAPKAVSIHRKEVYEEIVRANREAASISSDAISGLDELLGK